VFAIPTIPTITAHRGALRVDPACLASLRCASAASRSPGV
jgi:hypothetical protein